MDRTSKRSKVKIKGANGFFFWWMCGASSYLTEASHSKPPSSWDRFPELTLMKFGLVLVPLVVALADRRSIRLVAGPAGGHLRDRTATLLPTWVVGILRLRQASRIVDDLTAIAESSFIEWWRTRRSSLCFLCDSFLRCSTSGEEQEQKVEAVTRPWWSHGVFSGSWKFNNSGVGTTPKRDGLTASWF